jgi:hypothetical protein
VLPLGEHIVVTSKGIQSDRRRCRRRALAAVAPAQSLALRPINLETPNTFGIAMPPSMLVRANDVIR